MLLSKSIIPEENGGYSKADMEKQIEQIQEQLALIHLKLKANVDSEVWVQFQTKTNSLKQTELEFQRLKQLL
ncbi:hypothetical protein MKY30_18430 [Oceanobacillus sp. FSL W8-0428]|uniref:Uncharacterized protein n=2 Tax=Oceanobacillus TaxID=182709 RepID=A0A511ZD13_9BACI|nr:MULTISPECIES: hypothetical protein [Oceanobacillus]MCT1901134.1 hypothetical protein [Oceanobacillus sojae]GEN85335.1 hypothetical protein OSO01_00740 [Oceanobacillus sojae]GGP10545.1 hypothetical protein GCM10011346_19100 [Oceanobacillus neutriphilus]